MSKTKREITIPKYTLGEELVNSISHGIGAGLSIWLLVIAIIKAVNVSAMAVVSVSIYGTTMIMLYTMSCIYHALSPKITGKKVLRVLDHCNVYLLVLGTIIPIALVGVKGAAGWVLFSLVTFLTIVGIVFTAIDVEKFKVVSVICHLLNGWGVLFFCKPLVSNIGMNGLVMIILGGVMYSIGAILYGIGAKKKYIHSVFHFFCLFGSAFHFLAIYLYVI